MHSKAEKLKKVGFALTPLATGLTAWEAVSGNPLAFVSGGIAVVLAGHTIINIRTERKLRRELENRESAKEKK
ncbi:MAG: hypothetical protein HYT07_00065 [Candidatus Levybacteria bacterium]|nr:hypothetical protein [Candidatus Levybacteria bacterium]